MRDKKRPEGRDRPAGIREEIVVPVADEELEIGKRIVETGAVQVRKHVQERLKTVEAPLIQEVVDVRRVPVNREVQEMPAVRETEDEIVIPVVEEELVVAKRLILKEEIHVIRRRTKSRVRRQVTVGRESAEVVRVNRGGGG